MNTQPRPLAAEGIAGVLGLASNLMAIAFLGGIPHAWKPGDLGAWHSEITAHASNATGSAWSFTVGLVLLVPFALAWPRLPHIARPGLARIGALLFAGGALLDAAGTPTGAVVARFLPYTDPANSAAARALLGYSLFLDATFNGLLGAGLIVVNLAAGSALSRPLRALGVVAGLASLPVALQAVSDDYANLLAISGPLWLTWCTLVAVQMIRTRAIEPAPGAVTQR